MPPSRLKPDDFILAILQALPTHSVSGKKRLQKLAYLLSQTGVKANTQFRLKDFGPFSVDLARSAEFLTAVGRIAERQDRVEQYDKFITTYSLPSNQMQEGPRLNEKYTNILSILDNYTTIELEIASTIQYFTKHGLNESDAIKCTKQMKPSKSIPAVITKADHILRALALKNHEKEYSRSTHS